MGVNGMQIPRSELEGNLHCQELVCLIRSFTNAAGGQEMPSLFRSGKNKAERPGRAISASPPGRVP